MSRRRILFELCKRRALGLQAVSEVPGNPARTFQHVGSRTSYSASNGCGSFGCSSYIQSTGRSYHSVASGTPSSTCTGFAQAALSEIPFLFFSILSNNGRHAAQDVAYRRNVTGQAASTCWFCGEVLQLPSMLVCPNCGYVQHVREDVNYFQLFGMCVSLSCMWIQHLAHCLYSM